MEDLLRDISLIARIGESHASYGNFYSRVRLESALKCKRLCELLTLGAGLSLCSSRRFLSDEPEDSLRN